MEHNTPDHPDPDPRTDPMTESPESFRADQPEDTESTETIESLFEHYEPRPVSTILAQQNAIKDSDAAEAAAIILDGVVPPEFTDETPQITIPDDHDQHDQLLGDQRFARSIRVQKLTPAAHLVTPGAQFIYALIIITLLGGLIGLAATLHTPVLILVAGIASPILLPICIWKWIRWLDSTPYYYRLLTSLGEDARNLLHFRLLWKRSKQNH